MLIVLCCASVLCFAQTDRGSIAGVVTDPTGAVVPGAKITVTNTAMGTQSGTVSTGSGTYNVPELAGGTYSVTVTAPGFTTLIRNGITVVVDQTASVDLKLGVGQGTTTVTVTADAPLIQTDSAQNNVEVTAKDMNDLPFNVAGVGAVRDPMSFAALVPGTIAGGWNDVHIQGSPGTTYRVFMDGIDDTSAVKGAISDEMQPSVESLASQSLMVNDYAAEFGQAAGGIFNYTSKSGTNRLHGTLFNYLENEDLDAGQPFNHTASGNNVLPVQRQLDFGGSVGGPIVFPHLYNGRDKTFFFVAYEEYHNTQTLNQGLITVPTNAYLTGDLSGLLQGPINPVAGVAVVDCLGRQIYNGEVFDPSTTRTVPLCTNGATNVVVRDGFGTGPGGTGVPTNFIGAPSTWDPVAKAVLKYMPTPLGPTASALNNNYPNYQPNNKYQYLTSVKIDHNIGEAWHLAGYYIAEYSDKDNADDGINTIGGSTRWNLTPAPQLYLNADYTATPRLVLHAGFDFTSHNALQDAVVQNFDQTTLGLPSLASMPGGAAGTFPIFSGLSVNTAGVPNMGVNNAPFIDHNWALTGSATWIHGDHTVKFGGDFRHQWFGTHNDLSDGSYSFGSGQTGQTSSNGQNLNGGSVGNGFASFALGQLSGASIGNDNIQWFHRVEGGYYAQDTWKVSRKFTVNYGIRWDLEQMQIEQRERETQFGANVVNPTAGGLLGGTEYEGYGTGRCNCVFEHFYPWMIQPRLGFNYQINPKTVVHAGIGLYSGQQLFMNEIGYSNQGFGFNQAVLTSPGYDLAAGLLKNGVPFVPSALTAVNFDPGHWPTSPSGLNAPPNFTVPNNGRPARFIQTTIGFEREIARDLAFEAAFVDNRGVWLESDGLRGYNQLPLSALSALGYNVASTAITAGSGRTVTDFAYLKQSIATDGVVKPPYPTFATSNSLAQSLRPFPQFSGVHDQYERDGNTWYDLLQAKLTKRLRNGLSGGAGYAWSKDLGDVTATGTYTVAVQNEDPTRPPKASKTYMQIDQPFSVNFFFNYEVPRLAFAQSGWKAAIFAGWTTDGIFRYASGFPIQTPNSTSTLTSVTFGNNVFANRVQGQPLFLASLNHHNANPYNTFFLNPAAWSNPVQGVYSTSKASYGDYRASRYPGEQMGFGKSFDIHEGVKFSLRADFFNVFNHWAYPGLNNTGSPFATPKTNPNGSISAGFGYLGNSISGAGGNFAPRSGEFVARFQF
jgi:hypothetical protein